MATLSYIAEQIELSEQLAAGRSTMSEPQDLPGRFGRVIRDVNRVLSATHSTAVLAGGWAVWWHGYTARLTKDVDIVLPEVEIQDFLNTAGVAGFQVLNVPEGSWPKVQHKETDVTVDILPEGERPGTANRPAPTLIGHPQQMGGVVSRLKYIDLASLVELKLAAGRTKDELDVIELLRARPDCMESVRQHLVTVHADYVTMFDALAAKAMQDESR